MTTHTKPRTESISQILNRALLAMWAVAFAFAALVLSVFIWRDYKVNAERTQIELQESSMAIGRALSGELWLGELAQVEPLVQRLKANYGLEGLEIAETGASCETFKQASVCHSFQLPGLNGERFEVITKPVSFELLEHAIDIPPLVLGPVLLATLTEFLFLRRALSQRLHRTFRDFLRNQARAAIVAEDGARTRPKTSHSIAEMKKLSEVIWSLGDEIQLKNQQLLETERRVATAQATANLVSMISHDVRKPFSWLKALTSLLSSTKDSEKLKEIHDAAGPEISA